MQYVEDNNLLYILRIISGFLTVFYFSLGTPLLVEYSK